MPIIIKDISWNQTDRTLTVKVPLKRIHQPKADIFYSKSYVKISFEKYFFEAFLLHEIDTKSSTCTVTEDSVVFELVKCEPQSWDTLERNITKAEKQALKNVLLEEEFQQIREQQKERESKKGELKRVGVREQMSLDADERKLIEDIKQEEKNTALQDINKWKTSCDKNQKKRRNQRINEVTERSEKVIEPPLAPPRAVATLHIEFTERQFPTPCRESRLEEENEWLRKQGEARRSVGFVSEDLRPEEHNPHYMKIKGDEFLRNRNFLGAISAYSFGIKLNRNFADLYVGRSEAHLAVGNNYRVVEDCSTALELMKPEVPANLRERALCIGRRGTALVSLGMKREGIEELKASLRLEPNESFSSKLDEATEDSCT